MKTKKFGWRMSAVILFVFLSLSAAGTSVGDQGNSPVSVAIFPFTMHAPSHLAYLQDGIRDMLTSRLGWQDKVRVVDRTAVDQAIRGMKSDLSPDDALRLGRALNADYVLFGSVTAIGQSVSLDAKMAPVRGNAEPVTLYAQTATLDEVIPKVNQFAQNVNQRVFSRPSEQAQTSFEDDASRIRNPELLIPDSMAGSDRISYLNPNFVEITPEASLRQAGLWRSQTFKEAIVGMDVGDLSGDGRTELVAVTFNKLSVYRRESHGLKLIATFDGNNLDRFIWVSLVDMNGDGKQEIFVTNLRRQNFTRPETGQSINTPGSVDILSSFGLSLVNEKLQLLCDKQPYFLNGVELPKRGKVLLGQQKGTQTTFKTGIHEMQLRGDNLVPTTSLELPSACTIYNFAKADINNDNIDEIIVIDKSHNLLILNPAGERIWRGNKLFGATTNAFEGKVDDRRFNHIEYYSIPSPILVTDLNKDGIPEIVVNRILDNITKFLPKSLQSYEKGEIISLSWDQLGLVENWRTREISGMVTSIRVGDLSNDGTTELIAGLVLSKDFLNMGDSKSTVFSYDLNVSPSSQAAAARLP